MSERRPILLILSGLPGVGKSTVAKSLSARTGGFYLRIDTIEQALATSTLRINRAEDAGYAIACAIASDNLCGGKVVIADSVNPLPVTRDAFLAVAQECGAAAIEVEVICSDPIMHRHRVETRASDIPGLALPDWQSVVSREYHPWTRERLVLDTAKVSVGQCVDHILGYLPGH